MARRRTALHLRPDAGVGFHALSSTTHIERPGRWVRKEIEKKKKRRVYLFREGKGGKGKDKTTRVLA